MVAKQTLGYACLNSCIYTISKHRYVGGPTAREISSALWLSENLGNMFAHLREPIVYEISGALWVGENLGNAFTQRCARGLNKDLFWHFSFEFDVLLMMEFFAGTLTPLA